MPDRLMESPVRFAGDGYLVRAVLVAPTGEGRHPTVIVNPGAGGMSQKDVDVGRRLARAGYVALVVDPYSSVPEDKLPAELNYQNLLPIFRNLDDRSYMITLGKACQYVNSLPNVQPDTCGVLGFCAPWSILFACQDPKVKAAIGFYNVLRWREQSKADRSVQPIDRIPSLWAPLMCHYGDSDTATPVEWMEEVRQLGAKYAKSVEVHVYPGCGHGFVEPGGAYKEKEAELAWSRSLAFLEKHLK